MRERFTVVYRLSGTEQEAHQKALDLCLEQTVELPEDLLPESVRPVIGQLEDLSALSANAFRATVSFAAETSAGELTQLLNVIIGNISLKPGYRVEEISLPASMTAAYRGPRFGRQGLRQLLQAPSRPLLCSALKPLGLNAAELARLAYQFALGGLDIIKDDHGLTDQRYAPFGQRVELCAQAVARANRETGGHSLYVANVTAPYGEVFKRAGYAKECGAGGLLIAPGLTGFDTLRALADEDALALPLLSHPACLGSWVLHPEHGIAHLALFGQINRLAGADAVIYPSFGGRFSFSRAECQQITQGTAQPMHGIKAIFPCPAGGLSLSSIPEQLQVYGQDVMFLMGGGLFRQGPDIVENCRYFRRLAEEAAQGESPKNSEKNG
ncbi:MAG: ribulose 1,5-bisphosphate carboxylase large subunit [Peptococcaceae bacterium]|jgi:ribulose-bisphosphate carboxylase large chain|nr:ribulose 1,5-bisphosphate carboxylase large subunit [Peptococcaceae bacterium]